MYVLTEWLLSFNWQRFTLHKNEKRNLELYRKLPSSTNLLNYPRINYVHVSFCGEIGKISKLLVKKNMCLSMSHDIYTSLDKYFGDDKVKFCLSCN